jgi:predicted GNAT family acetyltransferase
MIRKIYRKNETKNWKQFIANKYAEFLYSNYSGGKPMPEDKDIYRVTGETIDSDTVLSIEDGDNIVGMTSYKVFKNTIWIKEICVGFKYRGKGISNELRKWMVEEENPHIIIGLAHNPTSVISRSNTFHKLGYQTYWGNLPVDDGEISVEELDEISREFIKETYPQHMASYKDGIVAYTDANIWAEEPLEELKNKNVSLVLKKALNFQKENNISAMATLISIKKTT